MFHHNEKNPQASAFLYNPWNKIKKCACARICCGILSLRSPLNQVYSELPAVEHLSYLTFCFPAPAAVVWGEKDFWLFQLSPKGPGQRAQPLPQQTQSAQGAPGHLQSWDQSSG